MKKVRYVMVGFGALAEERLAREGFACDVRRFRPLRYAELVGATDIDPTREPAARALGLTWYATLDEVFGDDQVDAVCVATDNASHVELALQAMKAGKHAIVERPMATTVADAKRLNAFAKSKRLSLSVDQMMVYNAWNMAGRQAMAVGRIGKVEDCCYHIEVPYGLDAEEAATWRCARPDEMGGPVGDAAGHCFYVAEFMFGRRIAKLGAVYYPKTTKTKCEDGVYVRFSFADGQSGSARCAFCERRGGRAGRLTSLGYEIYGDQGVMRGYGTLSQLSGYSDDPVTMRLEIDDGRRILPLRPTKVIDIFQTVVESHAKSVLDGTPLAADEAVHNLALCAACHASAQKGGRIVSVKD